ncbi:MAG TPA: hypothetical protein VFX12_01645 [Vicinamibacterales bacterium]|nr:hypothetical protein [Vicinamibacterales bacterium]
MSPRLKIAIGIVVALAVAVAVGFAWGASGRLPAEHALAEATQRLDLADARGHILQARVSLYNVNFGDAQQQLEDAKAPLQRAHDRAQQAGQREAAQALGEALTHAQEAQRLAGRLDQGANTQADAALKSIAAAMK